MHKFPLFKLLDCDLCLNHNFLHNSSCPIYVVIFFTYPFYSLSLHSIFSDSMTYLRFIRIIYIEVIFTQQIFIKNLLYAA